MSVVNMCDVEITPGNKMTKKSVIMKRAVQLMRQRRQFTIEEFEEVFDPLELMLTCHEELQDKEKRMGNNNNPTGKNSK